MFVKMEESASRLQESLDLLLGRLHCCSGGFKQRGQLWEARRRVLFSRSRIWEASDGGGGGGGTESEVACGVCVGGRAGRQAGRRPWEGREERWQREEVIESRQQQQQQSSDASQPASGASELR